MGALPSLELRCFGPPTATLGGRAAPSEVLWTKHLAILIYLALSPDKRRSREHLMGIFWGESTQDRARGALNETVRRLRSFLGPRRLVNDGTAVVLNDQGLDVDALRVPGLIDRSPGDAVALLRGQFLEGFNVKRAPEFEDWAAREQTQFSQLRVRALIASGSEHLKAGDYGAAGALVRRVLDDEPRSEQAVTVLVQALALAGDRAAALAAFHAFAERLEREIGEQPSKALLALAERIRKGSLRPHASPHTPPEAPLVGRSNTHREVFAALVAGLTAGPRTVVVTAEPGMGRSRLLAECAAHAVLAGAHVVRARQLESDHDARWSLLRQVFRGGVLEAPGLSGARPDALAVLASLVPDLTPRFTPRAPLDVAEVGAAVAGVLSAIAEETPLILALDDVHWADGASLAALHAAIRSLGHARVTLTMTFATGVGAVPRELQQIEAEVGVALPGLATELKPLDLDDLRALIIRLAPWCDAEADRDRLARRLRSETEGNPLFAVTLLAALERANRLRTDLMTWPLPTRTSIDPIPISVPSVVQQAVQIRIAELSAEQRAILRAAAIGSESLDLPLIAQLAEATLDDVERALSDLERRHLVKYDGHRYAFVAPLVALVVRESDLTRGERNRIEVRAIAALANRDDLEARALRCKLLARVESNAAALGYVVATVRAAVDVGAMRLARLAWAAGDQIATTGKLDRRELDLLKP